MDKIIEKTRTKMLCSYRFPETDTETHTLTIDKKKQFTMMQMLEK